MRVVTRFFEAGGTRVLVGTRGLLGEGWDARRVTGLVDLTAVTTTTAVVQTRGRALRTDPSWPEKVALTWSVVCVSDAHPKGGNDWDRLVRKHSGFYGLDERGDVVDGVAHLDPAFSAFAPPAVADFDAVNARMVVRSEDRGGDPRRLAGGGAVRRPRRPHGADPAHATGGARDVPRAGGGGPASGPPRARERASPTGHADLDGRGWGSPSPPGS